MPLLSEVADWAEITSFAYCLFGWVSDNSPTGTQTNIRGIMSLRRTHTRIGPRTLARVAKLLLHESLDVSATTLAYLIFSLPFLLHSPSGWPGLVTDHAVIFLIQ